MESAMILAIVVLGGMGSQIGVAIAAVVMIGGFELISGVRRGFRAVPHADLRAGHGAIMVWRPRGLIARAAVGFPERRKADRRGSGQGGQGMSGAGHDSSTSST
jgi:branched-chain amino acid transport system permease protein